MQAMTFNIKNDTVFTRDSWKYKNRVDRILDTIYRCDADILALQEVTDRMSELTNIEGYISYGVGRNKRLAIANEKNLILVKKDLFSILDRKTIWLAKDASPGSRHALGLYPRTCTHLHLQDSQGKSYHIFNTHLDPVSSLVRLSQCKILEDYIRKTCAMEENIVLLGDFNATLESKEMKYLVHSLGLKTCYETIHHPVS